VPHISILTIILLFLSASVSRIVFYVVIIVFCAAIVNNKLLIISQLGEKGRKIPLIAGAGMGH